MTSLFVTLSAEQQQSVFEALWTTPVSASPADISFAINTAIYGEVLGGVASEDALALLVRYNVNFAALEAIDDLQVRTFAYADFGQYTAFADDAEAQSVFDAIVAFWQALDFEGFRAMDQQSQLYAIGPVSSLRMKDYSDTAAAQAYLDSLVSAFTMELSRYDSLPDAYRALVDRSVSFDVASIMASSDPRAAAQAAFDAAILAAVNDYDALYAAEDDLIFWADFRSATEEDVITDLNSFVTKNTTEKNLSVSVSGTDAPAAFGNGFLDLPSSSAKLTLVNNNNNNSDDFLRQKNYTVSLVAAMENQTNLGGETFYFAGVRCGFDGRRGHLSLMSLRSSWIFRDYNASDGLDAYTRIFPEAMISTEGETLNNSDKAYQTITNGQPFNLTMTRIHYPTTTKMVDYLQGNPGSFVFSQTAYDNATFSDKNKVYDGQGDYTVRINGDIGISLNRAYYNNESVSIGYSALMKVYQMRIYNRVLTVGEQAQNQFADLASYYGLDLSQYIYLSGTVRSEFLTYMFEEANYGMMREAVQNMMDAKIDALLDALYAGIRVPDTDENAAVLNHFADLAQALRLNIGSYAMMSLPLRLAVATCFAGDELANLSYRTAQPRLTRAIEDALLSALLPDNLFTFVGWSYRMREGYGLRTYFDFDASTIAGLEENGYTVRVGILRLTNPMLTDSDYSKLFSLSGGVLTPVDGATIAYLYDATHALPEADKSGLVRLCHEQTYAETATDFSAQQLYIAFIAAIGEGGELMLRTCAAEGKNLGATPSAYEIASYLQYGYRESAEDTASPYLNVANLVQTRTLCNNRVDVRRLYTLWEEFLGYTDVTDDTTINGATLNEYYQIRYRADADPSLIGMLRCYRNADGEMVDILAGLETKLDYLESLHGRDYRDDFAPIPEETNPATTLVITTDKPAYTYAVGDEVTVTVRLVNKKTGAAVPCATFSYEVYRDFASDVLRGTDDGGDGEVTFRFVMEQAGAARFFISAKNADGSYVENCECYRGGNEAGGIGGAIAGWTALQPDILNKSGYSVSQTEAYWKQHIAALYEIDPTDTTVPTAATVYDYVNGGVQVASGEIYDIDGKSYCYNNYYRAKKLTRADLEALVANGRFNSSRIDSYLNGWDIYDVTLKCAGPTPVTGYLTVPKGRANGSLDILINLHAYSPSSSNIICASDAIIFEVNHHGYLNGQTDAYYNGLRGDICGSYGKSGTAKNSRYDDIDDCYMLYLFLRDIQAVRYVADSSISRVDTEGNAIRTSALWNGELRINGSSMGGYQTLALSGLLSMLPDTAQKLDGNLVASAAIPAYTNLYGASAGRIDDVFRIGYMAGAEHFDAALLAGYIDADAHVTISRCGLGDYTCPPVGILAAYNRMKCDKTINIYQNSSHSYQQAGDAYHTDARSPIWTEHANKQ